MRLLVGSILIFLVCSECLGKAKALVKGSCGAVVGRLGVVLNVMVAFGVLRGDTCWGGQKGGTAEQGLGGRPEAQAGGAKGGNGQESRKGGGRRENTLSSKKRIGPGEKRGKKEKGDRDGEDRWDERQKQRRDKRGRQKRR
ncbi:hypothetical protein Tco_0091453 [Tanacetum coccineum]